MAEILYSSLLWQTRGLEPYKHKERRPILDKSAQTDCTTPLTARKGGIFY